MQLRCLLVLLCFCVAVPSSLVAEEITREQTKFFEEQVRPLLAARCFKCHGGQKQKGQLRLDTLGGVLAGGESGAAVVPGKPEESLLVEAINHESFEMPPDGKLPDADIATLTRWIKVGAPWPGGDASVPVRKEREFTAEERAWWAFQPLTQIEPPDVEGNDWSAEAIDQFIYRKLREANLSPSPQASRRALVRRVYFDLVGVPPTPAEVEQFVADRSPDAYEKLIDRLLASEQYGERWARHWLDLVRYAESDGYKQDAFRPEAWRYRDYVIRSLNEDKPYDQFIAEQLAGDEINPDNPDAIIATGFLRHGIYEYNQRDVRTQWTNMVDEVTDVTADVFLGLGMSCAKCHDHKFDPILRKDYYRLRAFFAPMKQPDDLPLPHSDRADWEKYKQQRKDYESATAEIQARIDELERPHYEAAGRTANDKFPPDIRDLLDKDPSERNPLETQLAELADRQIATDRAKVKLAEKMKGVKKILWEELKDQLARFEKQKPPARPTAFCVTDVGPLAPVTFIPGDKDESPIEPGFLSILDPSPASIERPEDGNTTGRRTALAAWIASPDNPLSTRVIVNRVWQYHFGRGLVATSSDFGRLGEPPSHPELLDWLTGKFIAGGWRLKPLHKSILMSKTYQQAAVVEPPKQAALVDPENRLLWRMNICRLDAEQVRDAMLAASGELQPPPGGPSSSSGKPHRSIYCKVLRNDRDPLLDAFDAPDYFTSVASRNTTTTPVQSLLMINGEWTLKRAAAFADQLREAPSIHAQVQQAFRYAYGRTASPDELKIASEFLKSQIALRAGAENEAENTSFDGGSSATMAEQQGPAGDFTVEAIVELESLYPDATVRTIASHWNDDNKSPGWSLGVTSTKSAYQPRNLILQLVGKTSKGDVHYEVIASNLRPELEKKYYVAVSVDLEDTSERGVTFYMKELGDDQAEMQTASASHQVVSGRLSSSPIVIGGRAGSKRHFWHGEIDRVRITAARLDSNALLSAEAPLDESAGFEWTKDSAAAMIVRSDARKTSPAQAALVDFCHVLLNSSEFLYVD